MSNKINQALADTLDMELNDQVPVESVDQNKQIVPAEDDVKEQKYKLEDKDYIKNELQSLIEENRAVLETLGEQAKLGAPPRLFEVYSNLSSTITQNLNSLVALNKTNADLQIAEANEKIKRQALMTKAKALAAAENMQNGTLVQNNTYNFTSNEMLKMLQELKLHKEVISEEALPKFDLS